MSGAPSFEFVEGALGDLAFVARGATCGEALAQAAEALLAATVEEPATVHDGATRHVTLSATDPDLLLLRLLNELVYLRDAEGLLLRARSLRIAGEGGRIRLEAELVGEPWCPGRHVPAAEVKAATAHGLSLRPVGGGWEARATLDV